jgi:hypothetical protein
VDYWDKTVVCRRKGLCHITHEQCLEFHDLDRCGDCKFFYMIIEIQEQQEMDDRVEIAQRQALAPKKRRKKK